MAVSIDFTKQHVFFPRIQQFDSGLKWYAIWATNGLSVLDPSYSEFPILSPYSGNTAFYPPLTYTFTGGASSLGQLAYNAPQVDCDLAGAGVGKGFHRYYYVFNSPGIPFWIYRLVNSAAVPGDNSQASLINFEQLPSWALNSSAEWSGGPAGARVGRKFISPDTGAEVIWTYGYYRVTEVPTAGTEYAGFLDLTPDEYQAANVVDNGQWAAVSQDTSAYVDYFNSIRSFFVDLGLDYQELYNEYIAAYNQYLALLAQQAKALSSSGAEIERDEEGNPAIPDVASLPSIPEFDLPTMTVQAAKQLEKAQKLNEELVQLTDAGMELDPHFAKLTDIYASFARGQFDKHTFKPVFRRDSLNRVQGMKGGDNGSQR